MEIHKVEKFFNNTCTPEEAKQVVTWFATAEGQAYLAKRWEVDAKQLQDKHIKPMLSDLDSAEMWRSIEAGMSPGKKYNLKYNQKRVGSYWYVAAIILVACVFSVVFSLTHFSPAKTAKNKQPTHFITSAHQHKTLILSDGTKVKLNSNSQLWVSADYGEGNRDVTLKGEAYFVVKHDRAHPFVVHVQGALIKDLGTVFNVRAIPSENNVQVTVKSGKVSFYPKHKPKKKAVKLTKGQYGYLNLKTGSISVNTFAVGNYLSWMSNQLKFDNAPLKKVSRQLSRIYNVSFEYASDSLKGMRLSAVFERGSLKKALAVISLTLSIDYQRTDGQVIWKDK